MQRGNLDDLLAFLAVAKERSFTRAAAKLGMSQSSLSHTIREREARLGVRLLPAPPAAWRQRKQATASSKPSARASKRSTLRSRRCATCVRNRLARLDHATEYAADAVLLPKLAKLLPKYPDIKVEIVVDYGLSNIVTEGYDVGVRSGEQLPKTRSRRASGGTAHGRRRDAVLFLSAT